jgi:hypothetical protein
VLADAGLIERLIVHDPLPFLRGTPWVAVRRRLAKNLAHG